MSRLQTASPLLALVFAAAVQAQPFAYVSNRGTDDVSVINTANDLVMATPSVSRFSQPMGVAFNPDGSRAYVAGFFSGILSVIDTSTNQVIASQTIAGHSRGAGRGDVHVRCHRESGHAPRRRRGESSR